MICLFVVAAFVAFYLRLRFFMCSYFFIVQRAAMAAPPLHPPPTQPAASPSQLEFYLAATFCNNFLLLGFGTGFGWL